MEQTQPPPSAENDAPTPCGYGTATCRKFNGCDAGCGRDIPPVECDGCACPAEHDGNYGSAGHAGPCPPHTCVVPPGSGAREA